MSYSIYERRSHGLRRIGVSDARHDLLLPLLPPLAIQFDAEIVVEDHHGRLVATVSPAGDVTTTAALEQPTR